MDGGISLRTSTGKGFKLDPGNRTSFKRLPRVVSGYFAVTETIGQLTVATPSPIIMAFMALIQS
jgi:hypothetical protein